MELRADVALLDIEGTLGSIAYVREVLFPYADERLDAFVEENRDDPKVRALLDLAAREAGVDASDTAGILAALHRWIASDAKVTALKSLQGLIWQEGYERHGVRAHVYEDAIAAMRRYVADGAALYVYSSGSIAAQRLFFGYSAAGDLLPLLRGFFDTTIGSKVEAPSYARIAEAIGVEPARIAFFSDNAAELDAAREAGLQTVQLARPEDGTVAVDRHPAVTTFDGVALHLSRTAI
jgi:enolase-phosphatase E1